MPESYSIAYPSLMKAQNVAAQGWNQGFSENQFMEKNAIKVSVDANRLETL